ncbi:proprotein convertase subtilisin/kexin type 1 inhibitor, like [Notolabrus celidotus]|uniref:proprotein convertase subtilisin/kexin type 1 inhibitor, like n=1 Tax=Notolabrus celidotus TaxID=1203425 RepID=UPI00148FF18F|nr:proprotein convertase subtilisin/kexin type 1 inhibitor, like [Notolabrus celidotus]
MASLGLLLLSTALLHTVQARPAGHERGRGLDVSLVELSRQRRDLRNLLPYEDRMSYPVSQGGGGAMEPYYQADNWRGQGLDQALQRLVERDQRRAQEEEQKAAYLAALLRLLGEAESTGLVDPDVEVVEEEEDEEDDEGTPGDFQGPAPSDYDETGRGLNMGRPPAAWWGLLEPQLAQALLDRMEPQVAQTLLQRARQQRLQQAGPGPSSRDGEQEALRRLVARLLSGVGPSAPAVMSSGRRVRRGVSFAPVELASPAHRRSRRSLEDMAPPSPSSDPPLLRVKRLEDEEEEEEEEKLRPPAAGLQRMKRIDTMATNAMEELNHGSQRRRRRALNYDPQILIDQILQYMRE